jgi:hypothetical protein
MSAKILEALVATADAAYPDGMVRSAHKDEDVGDTLALFIARELADMAHEGNLAEALEAARQSMVRAREELDGVIQAFDDRLSALPDTVTVEIDGKTYKLRCPDENRGEDDVVGCGSDKVTGPNGEGLYDCECGMWFDLKAAKKELVE